MSPPSDDSVVATVETAVSGHGDRKQRTRAAAAAIRAAGEYRWVGIYDVTSQEVSIIAWSGPGAPAHPTFPRDQGLTATAVAEATTVVVNDVTTDPRYLTAFGSTQSELIAPVLDEADEGRVIGTLDVESEHRAAFSDTDREQLEACATALLPLYSVGH